MRNHVEAFGLAIATLAVFIAAAFAQDAGFQTHAWVLFFVLAIATLILLNRIEFGDAKMIPLKTNGGASTAAPRPSSSSSS